MTAFVGFTEDTSDPTAWVNITEEQKYAEWSEYYESSIQTRRIFPGLEIDTYEEYCDHWDGFFK